MSRTDTNKLLKVIAENASGEDENYYIYLTLGVNGNLITGTAISEDEFFQLKENSPFKEIFNEQIKDQRNEILDMPESEKDDIEFPDELKEYFVYLKDARYIIGNDFFPSGDQNPLSVQIRVSDISSVSFTSFSPRQDEQEAPVDTST